MTYAFLTSKVFREKNSKLEEPKVLSINSTIEEMTTNYGFNDTNDFLLSLNMDIKLPEKTRDIYLYLPYRMLDIYPVVQKFSNINLMNGDIKKVPFYFVSKRFKQVESTVNLGNGISFDLKSKTVKINNNIVKIRRFVETFYSKDKTLKRKDIISNFQGEINIIYMSDYKTFLLLDEQSYNSLYIQLMVLEEYDKSLFEEVIMNPDVKIYKLKI